MSILRRLFDSSYHHLSEKRANEYIILIDARYDKLIEKYGDSLFKKTEFHDRYRNALKNELDLYRFFKNETEYMDGLLEKIKITEERVDVEDENDGEENGEFGDEVSVFEKIYGDYEKKLQAYPKIDIHQDASEEIERLLGCMAAFGKKAIIGFRSIGSRMDRHNPTKQAIEKLYYLMDDFCVFKRRELPLAFREYMIKVQNAMGDDQLIELADINILKMAVVILKKVKSIASDVDDIFLARFGNVLIHYGEENMKIERFFDEIKGDCRKILEDFRIDEL